MKLSGGDSKFGVDEPKKIAEAGCGTDQRDRRPRGIELDAHCLVPLKRAPAPPTSTAPAQPSMDRNSATVRSRHC